MAVEVTGEYLIPGRYLKRVEDEHVERYNFAGKYVKGRRVLDIACGVGYGSLLLAEHGAAKVDGLDISADNVSYAEEHYHADNVSFKVGDILRYHHNVPYDVITCIETIEHVDDHKAALRNLYSLLKEGGILIISSPNRPVTCPFATSLDDEITNNEFHVREFTIGELKNDLLECGFHVDEEDIYGQRQRRHFNNRYLRKIHRILFNPEERSNPALTPIGHLDPKYFIIIARKLSG